MRRRRLGLGLKLGLGLGHGLGLGLSVGRRAVKANGPSCAYRLLVVARCQ